jgi:hypothetical protein
MSGFFSFSSRRHRRAATFACIGLATLLPLVGCDTYVAVREGASASLGTGQTFAIYGLEGRWAGAVTPTAADCGAATQGSMTVSAHGFAFDPFGSTFVINGTISDRGELHGVLKRELSAQGGKHVERALTFNGRGQQPEGGEARIVGRLESGRCTWQVALQRA